MSGDMECNNLFDHIDDLLDFPQDTKNNFFFVGCSPDLAAELSIPYEDIVQMEWLSTFMEDSFSAGNTMTQQLSFTNEEVAVQFQSSSPISVLESSSSSSYFSDQSKIHNSRVKGRCGRGARRKRPRPPTFNPGSALQLISTENLNDLTNAKNMTMKRSCPADRKCLHCEITKTPQWRAGPLGPKTLCNACGVRYKSGRLFPEYRPAASPTFVPSLHSSSHKKVLEMRTTTTKLDTPITTLTIDAPELIPNKDAMLEYM
ncbi:unnamed protein product [Rhodiola kirilowii]